MRPHESENSKKNAGPSDECFNPENGKREYDYELSERETEILKLTIDGYSYRQIAEKLFLSGNIVKKHLANIYLKLHVTFKAQATKGKLI